MASRILQHSRRFLGSRVVIRRYTTADPFVLPLSREATERATEKETPLPARIHRENETVSALRARLVYQSRKRGMLEGDLILSTFAAEQLPLMNEAELLEYDRLLDEPDWDIYYWAIEKKPPPQRWENTELLKKLRIHTKNEGKVVRMMPGLHRQEKDA